MRIRHHLFSLKFRGLNVNAHLNIKISIKIKMSEFELV